MATLPLKHFTGSDALSDALQAFPREMRNKILRTAMEEAVEPIKVAAKRYARRSRDTGATEASLDKKVINYPHDGVAVGMVGPTRDYFKGKKKLGRTDDRRGSEQPARRFHLLEFGHNIVVGGSSRDKFKLALVETGKFSKNGKPIKRWKRAGVASKAPGRVVGFVPARPILRPAVETTRDEVARRFFEGIDKGISQIRAKGIKEGSHAV